MFSGKNEMENRLLGRYNWGKIFLMRLDDSVLCYAWFRIPQTIQLFVRMVTAFAKFCGNAGYSTFLVISRTLVIDWLFLRKALSPQKAVNHPSIIPRTPLTQVTASLVRELVCARRKAQWDQWIIGGVIGMCSDSTDCAQSGLMCDYHLHSVSVFSKVSHYA